MVWQIVCWFGKDNVFLNHLLEMDWPVAANPVRGDVRNAIQLSAQVFLIRQIAKRINCLLVLALFPQFCNRC